MRAGTSPDPGLAGPGVVRLNRRVVYLVGAILIGATVAGLVAIRAQRPRADEDGGHRQTALQPASHPWFEGVPDQDLIPPSAAVGPVPSPRSPASSPTLVAAVPNTEEQEAQRRQRILHASMSEPIGVK